jgi:hypothetical protein
VNLQALQIEKQGLLQVPNLYHQSPHRQIQATRNAAKNQRHIMLVKYN